MSKTSRKILAAVLASAMAFSLTGCNDMFKKNENSENSKTSQVSSQASEAVSKFGGNIAVKSENFTVGLPMVQRMFKNTYNDFVNYYASNYEFDTAKSSKVQYYDEENKITWYDEFIDSAKGSVKQLLVLCELAKKDGFSIDEADQKTVDENIANMQTAADNAGQTLDEYIESVFGTGLNEQEVRNNIEQTLLATKYYQKLYNSFTYTDEDYEKAYEENKESYLYADFLFFAFGYGTTDSSEVSVTINEKQKETAKKAADELLRVRTEEEFNAYITKYLNENRDYVNITTDESHTEEDYQAAIKSQVNSAKVEKYAYEATSEAGKWIFSDERKVGDTYEFEGTSSYNVVMVLKPSYRDESIKKNVRHILFTKDKYETDEKAKEMAEKVYDEWKKGEATEDSFAELAKIHNADSDSGSAANGGLYTDVYEGQMVTEFNDWVFAPERKTGDTGIVKTTYGYHIIYFVGDTMPTWKSSVDTVLRRNDYTEKYTELEKTITVEFDDDYIRTIPDPTEEIDPDDTSEVSEESK